MAQKRILSHGDRVFMACVYLLLGLFSLAVAYPLLYVVSCSFSSPLALISVRVFLLALEAGLLVYLDVFKTPAIWIGYRNSILYVVIGTAMSVLCSMMAAFPLTRREFPAKVFFTWFFSVTMFIGGGLIPSYLLVKSLGLMNTMWALILPSLFSAWAIIITRTFISSSIPEELFEAATVDGCNHLRYFFQMVLPLSKAIMAVLALGYATGMWNSYFSALLYISDASKFPLQLILKNILVQNVVDFTAIDKVANVQDLIMKRYIAELLKYSLIVVSSLPLLLFYPFIQRYFIKGVMIGSIKG